MRKTSIINVSLIAALLTMLVIIFSIIIAKQNYASDTTKIQSMLADRSIINYFKSEQIETTYNVDGTDEVVALSELCVDCDESIANMHNSGSMLITDAPDSICDLDVERCVIYNFDPFGLGLFTRQTILRNEK